MDSGLNLLIHIDLDSISFVPTFYKCVLQIETQKMYDPDLSIGEKYVELTSKIFDNNI